MLGKPQICYGYGTKENISNIPNVPDVPDGNNHLVTMMTKLPSFLMLTIIPFYSHSEDQT
jgi:hypothetical protein